MPSTYLSLTFGRLRDKAPPLWLAIVLPSAFFAAAVASQSAFGTDTPIWVSNAFVVAALLRNKRSTWPALLFLTAIADYAAGTISSPPLLALGIAACDFFEILLIATVARAAGVSTLNGGIWPLARLTLICLAVPLIDSTAGSFLIKAFYGGPFWASWTTWYLGAIFGLLTVTPLLLSWTDPALRTRHSLGAAAQVLILAGLVAAVGYVTFEGTLPDRFAVFPFLLLATFNGRLLGATTAAAMLAAVAIWCTMTGHGPIATLSHADAVDQMLLLQLYIVTILLSTLPVAAILEQREKLTLQLQEATKAAQSAAQAKAEFVAVMSHEIRTPLTSMLGVADLLANAKLPAKEREYVKGLWTSGQHLLTLMNDILDFSRIEAGKLELESIEFGLPEVLEQVRSLLTPQATQRGLELRFELDPHAPTVLRGDPTRLKQVLINLVGNGIKFTHSGSVTVAVYCPPANDRGARFRFEIRDTGIGIPKEKQDKLFQSFSQLDSSRTRQYGGSGLGLAICKKLITAMGGEIGVESVQGIGSRFWFELPLELSERTSIAATAGPGFVEAESRRVLLVEDVELNQLLITDILRAQGHHVTLAKNGLEAVALAESEIFDVILMDVQMPVMDGMEATRRIRRLPLPAGEVPVLALSANVMPEDLERYMAAGMNGALTKPIDWPQLFGELARYGGSGQKAANNEEATGPDSLTPTAPHAETDSPIDSAVLERLRGLRGKTGDLRLELAELFMHDTGQRLQELQHAVRCADAPAVARIAHAIKGSAANLGAKIVVRICAEIEARAEAADLGAAPTLLDELQHEFTHACDALLATRTEA